MRNEIESFVKSENSTQTQLPTQIKTYLKKSAAKYSTLPVDY